MRTSAAATIDYKLTRNDRLSLSTEVTRYESPLTRTPGLPPTVFASRTKHPARNDQAHGDGFWL